MPTELLSTRIARVCAGRSGRLPGLRFHDHAARAAVMIDLALWQRVGLDASGRLLMATAPTGMRPVDAMLEFFGRKPGRTLADMLDKAPLRMADCVDPARPRRRFDRRGYVDPVAATDERTRLTKAATAGHPDSPQTAALLLLADVLTLGPAVDTDRVLARCATAAAMAADCIEHLLQIRYRLELSEAARSSGGTGGGGGP